MKIAVWHNLPSGGGKRALHDQVAGLLARGHQVKVWCPENPDLDYLPLAELTQEHVLPFPYAPVLTRGVLAQSRKMYFSERRWAIAMERHARQCAEEIASGDFDLLFAAPCRHYFVPWIARHLRSLAPEMPRVLYLQEPNRPIYEAMPELSWVAPQRHAPDTPVLRRWIDEAAKLLMLYIIRQKARWDFENIRAYDQVLSNSLYSRESILRVYGQDSRVCYLGVDTQMFSPPRGEPQKSLVEEQFVIGLGSMNWPKGVDVIIRAVARIATPQPRLVWVANSVDSAYYAQMLRLAADEGVRFEMRQRIPDAELVELLRGARLMIYASRLEPFGYAPLEANACGTPVVAVSEGGVRETVVDGINGLLCEREPEALALAMTRVLQNAEFAAQLSHQARREAVEKWGLIHGIDRLEAELARVMESARVRESRHSKVSR